MATEEREAYQALVFGASGIVGTLHLPPPAILTAQAHRLTSQTGYPLLKQLVSYPTPKTFSRVIGLTHRPLSRDITQLPDDPRIELYSDLDLQDRDKTLFHLRQIPGIEYTTHVYYAAYAAHGSDYAELKRVNTEILTNAVGSCELCCPKMRFFTLQTGGKVSDTTIKQSYNRTR